MLIGFILMLCVFPLLISVVYLLLKYMKYYDPSEMSDERFSNYILKHPDKYKNYNKNGNNKNDFNYVKDYVRLTNLDISKQLDDFYTLILRNLFDFNNHSFDFSYNYNNDDYNYLSDKEIFFKLIKKHSKYKDNDNNNLQKIKESRYKYYYDKYDDSEYDLKEINTNLNNVLYFNKIYCKLFIEQKLDNKINKIKNMIDDENIKNFITFNDYKIFTNDDRLHYLDDETLQKMYDKSKNTNINNNNKRIEIIQEISNIATKLDNIYYDALQQTIEHINTLQELENEKAARKIESLNEFNDEIEELNNNVSAQYISSHVVSSYDKFVIPNNMKICYGVSPLDNSEKIEISKTVKDSNDNKITKTNTVNKVTPSDNSNVSLSDNKSENQYISSSLTSVQQPNFNINNNDDNKDNDLDLMIENNIYHI